MKDNLGREWAGNPELQASITKAIMNRFNQVHPIDLVGALETCMANMICDNATSRADALEGLQLCVDDMTANVINLRFPAASH